MNKRIPNGSQRVWRFNPAGSKQGCLVLAQHRDIQATEHSGSYTVKVYRSEKDTTEDSRWRHKRIILKPSSSNGDFENIVIQGLSVG